MSADQVSDFVQTLLKLPPDQDPYQVVLENLKNILPTNVSQAFLNVLFANYGIASLGLLASPATISAKLYAGGGWLVQKRYTARGLVLAPNTALFHSILSAIFFVVSIMSTFFYLAIYKDKQNRAANSYIEGLRWFPIAWLLTAEAWGATVAAYLASTQGSPNSGNKWAKAIAGRSFITPRSLNIFFLANFLIQAVIILFLFIRYAVIYSRLDGATSAFKASMNEASENWSPGQTFQLSSAFVAGFGKIGVESTKFTTAASQACQGTGFLLLILTLVVYLPATYFYQKMLRHQLTVTVIFSLRVLSLAFAWLTQENSRFLQIQSVGILLMGFSHVGLALWIGLSPASVYQDTHKMSIIVSTSSYFFGCTVAPINCLLFYKALRPILRKRKQQSQQGVQIHTSVCQQVDTGKDDDDNRYPIEYEILGVPASSESQFNLQAHTVALKKLPSFSTPIDIDSDVDLEKEKP